MLIIVLHLMVSYVIIAVLIAFVQRARKPSRNYETKLPDSVSTYEYLFEDQLPAFDCANVEDSKVYFETLESDYKLKIAELEEKKNKESELIERVGIQGEIIWLKKELSGLRLQYKDYCQHL